MQEITIKDLEQQIAELSIENVKLKEREDKLTSLILLTDLVVSHVVVGDTQLKQWSEFSRCFPSGE